MTQDEALKLRALWAMYAGYFRQQIADEVLIMYADDLADLNFVDVKNALDSYRKNPKNRMLPMPSQIREVIQPVVDHESAAKEIAARITHAITKYGWSSGDKAKEYIGPIGWGIVNKQGGWMHLCENHGLTINPTSFQAQARDLAVAALKYPEAAMNQAIGLPPVSSEILKLIKTKDMP